QVFMMQPPSFADPHYPHYVCQLHRSLYGFKQAPRAWYEELQDALFKTSTADTSLFIKIDTSATFLLVYVDDIVITGNDSNYCTTLISQLRQQFAIKYLGPFHYFLGLEAHCDVSGLFLSQTKYTVDVLKKTDTIDAKPYPSPATFSKLDSQIGSLLSDPTTYRSIVGALQ
ncbi:PREDICTED: poly, partial [Prunus dulcis]